MTAEEEPRHKPSEANRLHLQIDFQRSAAGDEARIVSTKEFTVSAYG